LMKSVHWNVARVSDGFSLHAGRSVVIALPAWGIRTRVLWDLLVSDHHRLFGTVQVKKINAEGCPASSGGKARSRLSLSNGAGIYEVEFFRVRHTLQRVFVDLNHVNNFGYHEIP